MPGDIAEYEFPRTGAIRIWMGRLKDVAISPQRMRSLSASLAHAPCFGFVDWDFALYALLRLTEVKFDVPVIPRR